MNRRTEKKLNALHDGALSERERQRMHARVHAEPELRRYLDETRALGSIVREAWSEGPRAPAPEYVISALRPAMARIDAERAAASPWARTREILSDWLRPAPIAAALIGTTALVLIAVLPTPRNPVLRDSLTTNFSGARSMATVEPNPLIEPVSQSGSALHAPGAIYDIASEGTPLMFFESEDATVIWVIPDDSLSRHTKPGFSRDGWA